MDSAADDLARNTLSRIRTVFGRLVYLAALCGGKPGAYRHDGASPTSWEG
jgi:hypothetical protein